MTVNRLSGNRVLIILEQRELDGYALDVARMDKGDSRSLRVLSALSRTACRRQGIAVEGRRLRVEALSLGADCYLLVTVDGGRVYRKTGGAVCYRFGNAGAVMGCAEQLYRCGFVPPRSSLYAHGGDFFLVFAYPAVPRRARVLLSEFDGRRCPRLTAARLAEHGRLLCHQNAVAALGKALV